MQSTQHSTGCFRHLFESLADPVVKFELVDGQPVIRDANDAFQDVFVDESTPVVDEPLNDLIVPEAKQQEAEQFDQRTDDGRSNAAVVERMTGDGERKFIYRGVPYNDDYGFAIYSDITDELQRDKHLDVLHRVLRHNLRNDLTVILGMATRIIDQTEDTQTQQAARKIKTTAQNLSRLSEEAKTIERVLGETAAVGPVALQPLAEDVGANCEALFETASITVDVPSELTVSANDQLQIVLRSLLDNAIRHNDSSTPRASVTARRHDPGTVELSVVDNGPGIPNDEQKLITDDAQITPLNHGSGLGLWLVKWIVDAYGGWIEIETPASGGTVVRLFLNTEQPANGAK